MFQKVKKTPLLFLGILFTGTLSVISLVSSYTRTSYSKDDSFFIATANADLGNWSWGGGGGGDGCGGCSGAGGDSAGG